MKRPPKTLLALAAAIALLAAACGSDGDDGQAAITTAETTTTTESSPNTEAETEAEPEAEPEAVGGFPIVNELEADFLTTFNSSEIEVLDSTMHYVTTGDASTHAVVLLHGQPTSSFLWRDVLPLLDTNGYVIAPDLIGMGRSGRPDIDYTLGDHVTYFDAFLDELDVETAVLVMHDVGGLTGLSWAAQNPERVTGVVMFEAGFAPVEDPSQIVVPEFAELLPIIRADDIESDVVYDIFVEGLIQSATISELPEAVLDVYRAPWLDPANRQAMVEWPRQLPIAGEPVESHQLMTAAFGWLTTTEAPKMLFFGEPGYLMPTPAVQFASSVIPDLETASVGAGTHYLQEDVPEKLGQELSTWLTANGG